MFQEIFKPANYIASVLFTSKELRETVPLGRAACLVRHFRPQDFSKDPATGLYTVPVQASYKEVDEAQLAWNVITDAGRDYMHAQCYGTATAGATFQWIGLSNATGPAASDVALAGGSEILLAAGTGLHRQQGTYTHVPATAGNPTTSTIDKTFTALIGVSAQLAALFTSGTVGAGVMNHEIPFTQRVLVAGDTLQTTFILTL